MNKPFYRIATEVKKLQETDTQLTQQLRKYIYNIVGCCQTVHRDMGPFLNEYMYQDALEICLSEAGFCGEDLIREYYFKTSFHNRPINHPHKVDFLVNGKVFVECKAVSALLPEHRQQLFNYMRLAGIRLGILYNFAPTVDQCEKYYYDPDLETIFIF